MHIKVKVTPGAKKESVEIVKKDRLNVSVREKAEENSANKKVKEILGGYFKVAPNRVKMVSGHKKRNKIFTIDF